MDRCPVCQRYVTTYNGDLYWCSHCRRWFTLDEVLPREAGGELTDDEEGQ